MITTSSASLVTLEPNHVTNRAGGCAVSRAPGEQVTMTNSGAGDRLRLGGNNTLCELTIEGAQIADSGQWTCTLTDNNMDTNALKAAYLAIGPI